VIVNNETRSPPERRHALQADRRTHSRRRTDVIPANAQAFHALVHHSHDVITVHDRDGLTLYESPSAARVLGYPPGSLVGRSPFDSIHPKDLVRIRGAFYRLLSGERSSAPIEFRFRHAHGEWIHLEALGNNLLDHAGIHGIVLTSRDITDRKRAEARESYLAQHDALTGLPNRLLMQDRLQQAIVQARRNSGQVALMFIDLDRFKRVNDSFGHGIGDTVLKQVSVRLSRCLRDSDSLARLGGDEFTVMLPEVPNAQLAGEVAERILSELSQPFIDGDKELHVSASIGISLFPRDGGLPDELVKHADAAMYSAKDSGRNSYRYFTEGLNEEVRERVALESGLRRAIERNELRLYYQPKIDLVSGKVMGAESLVRWQHPTLGLVAPARFIPIAEESGLIVQLGEWVLKSACEQIRAWRGKGVALPVAINMSARQIQRPNLAELVMDIIAACDVDPTLVEIEVTESAIMSDAMTSISTLQRMKSRGIAISIDDFGTGYSSLSYLKRLPLDILKIDQSFVRDITSDYNDAAIVRAIIGLARSLGIKVIAEGVEDDGQLSFLNAYGCNYAQGFLFGKPMDAERFTELIRTRGITTKR
jgi:diguanylate cyclase (GGDEF)-like protein/PAS domain S-box-containing protein